MSTAVSPTGGAPKMNGSVRVPLSPISVSKQSVGTSTPANVTLRPLLDLPSLSYEGPSDQGAYQMLASLALLCLLSLLMAFLALFFLQKVGGLPQPPPAASDSLDGSSTSAPRRLVLNAEEFVAVHQVSVALSTLTVSLDLCCLFVCTIQFLFAIKLMQTPQGEERTNTFLKKSSHTRIIAIGGFFLSIPIFFTGVILFTFVQFHEVPAIATSVAIGLGILFCGTASVHNVYLWQWEKTSASRELAESRLHQLRGTGNPDVTVELSTLV